MEQQLILFNDNPMEQMKLELNSIKKQLDNLRKGLFARHSELAKKYMENAYELEMLKSQICQSKTKINQRNSEDEIRGNGSEKVLQFDFAKEKMIDSTINTLTMQQKP